MPSSNSLLIDCFPTGYELAQVSITYCKEQNKSVTEKEKTNYYKIKVMKPGTKNLLTVLTIIDRKNLTTLIEDRLDVHFPETPKKKFGQVDLWNMNKQRKTFKTRRYL